MGKSTISMAIFNSYVSLPEDNPSLPWVHPKRIPQNSHRHPRPSKLVSTHRRGTQRRAPSTGTAPGPRLEGRETRRKLTEMAGKCQEKPRKLPDFLRKLIKTPEKWRTNRVSTKVESVYSWCLSSLGCLQSDSHGGQLNTPWQKCVRFQTMFGGHWVLGVKRYPCCLMFDVWCICISFSGWRSQNMFEARSF